MPLQTKPAKGVKGYIIHTFDGEGGGYCFRVYDKAENGSLPNFIRTNNGNS